MEIYVLFFSTFVLLLYRIIRSNKMRDKILLLSFFLFILLSFATHPWLSDSSTWLRFLEKVALLTTLLWLIGEPIAGWIEKRKLEKRAFYLLQNGKGPLSEIVWACKMLAEIRQGALIAIQKKLPLDRWAQTGVTLDAKIGREIIFSVFTPPGALHDGGMVIQGDRVVASGVLFPLSNRNDLPTELGTRHRAALGLSEVTDALAIIISEETGKISLADNGSLLYDVKTERLAEMLEKALKNRLVKTTKKAKQTIRSERREKSLV
ncbi:MAG: DNA integrity scanning protein DisA nucleotide-binding domain protein [Candidatus Omnitrophica bacterium]|nr:DNA integrity scanning protein DisA nucleotide-binding domain protein [Candidatus Omnitrophota bacterium]